MSNKPTPRKVNKTVVEQLYDDCQRVNQHLDLPGSVSYTVLYNPLTDSFVGLMYDLKKDQHYHFTSAQQYQNGPHQKRESAFQYFLSLNTKLQPEKANGHEPFRAHAIR